MGEFLFQIVVHFLDKGTYKVSEVGCLCLHIIGKVTNSVGPLR